MRHLDQWYPSWSSVSWTNFFNYYMVLLKIAIRHSVQKILQTAPLGLHYRFLLRTPFKQTIKKGEIKGTMGVNQVDRRL